MSSELILKWEAVREENGNLFDESLYDFSDEPLFQKNPHRKSLFPILHPELWNLYKKAEASMWTLEEIDFSGDRSDWDNKMTEDERRFIELILAFFAGADAIVNENLAENLLRSIDIQEVKCFYGFQIMIENIHNEVYSQLIETLISDKDRKDQLFNAIRPVVNPETGESECEIPAIAKLYDWAQKWIHRTPEDEYNSNEILQKMENQHEAYRLAIIWSRAKLLVAFASIEGIMFSGPFAAIFWLKEKGIMKGTTFSNEKISTDEGGHRDYACKLYTDKIHNKPPVQQTEGIVREAVVFEQEFMNYALDRLLGINRESMARYIEYVADHLMVSLKCKKLWNSKNPFPFMENISIFGFTNFFERKVAEYSMAGFEDEDAKGRIEEVMDDF